MIRGRRLQKSTLHQILRRRIYRGDFDWDRVTYKGNHQTLVSLETWQSGAGATRQSRQNETATIEACIVRTGHYPGNGARACGAG